ncbi:MAG: c-type cytochrome [Chloroflexota bacterium]
MSTDTSRSRRPWRSAVLGVAAFALATLLTGCADMTDQPSFKRQESPRLNFVSDAVPVTGAMPTYAPDQFAALKNPFAGQQDAATSGAPLYAINCSQCHGSDLKGTGKVAQYFPPGPSDLTGDRVKGLQDGQIFQAMTSGFGRMPSFAKFLTPDQRWQIVTYVRGVQSR